jgi:hypothetical protein
MSRLRSRLSDRSIVVVIAAAGIVLIAFPEPSTAIAHRVGAGRGVDLVIYLCLVGLAFSSLFSFSRVRSLEGKIAGMMRELVLQRTQWEQVEKRIGASRSGDATE